MMRSGLLSDLSTVGYEIFLDGDDIRLSYRKPGNPPDTVRQLIDELKKYKAEFIKILKAGNNTNTSEKNVESEAIVNAIWVNPHAKGTPEARQESLMAVMEAIWTREFHGIINQTLRGKQQIADFQKAVEAWGRMVKVG
jgi:hypothetical protein